MLETRRPLNVRPPGPRPSRASRVDVTVTGGGGGLTDADYGDVTVSGGGTVMTIDPGVVTNAKLRNSVGVSVIGRSAGAAGSPADIVAAADGDVLRRAAGAVGFGAVDQASVTNLVTDLAARALAARLINTTAPVQGGGDLTADRTLSLAANGITDALLRQGAARSVVGRAGAVAGDVADIAAAADGEVLRRAGGTLGFGADLPQASVTGLVADLAARALAARLINTTAPITGGGNLTADRTLALSNNGITDALLRPSAGQSVMGRAAAGVGNVADIASTADGEVLRRAAGVVGWGADLPQASITNLVTDLAARLQAAVANITSTSSTSTALANLNGGAMTLTTGNWLILAAGTHLTAAATTALRIGAAASGGLTVSNASFTLMCMTGATAIQASQFVALAAATAGTTGNTASAPWWGLGFVEVTADGTLTWQLASEVGGSNVTVQRGTFVALKVS